MSAPILDAPDRQTQAIWQRKMAGQPLTRAEEQRLAARFQAESQVGKEGGTAKRSIVPQQPTPSARQQGAGEAQWGVDYMRGKDEALRRNGLPGVLPATAVGAGAMTGMDAAIRQGGVRKSGVTNAAPDDVKSLDNLKGPHMGADGLPAMWKMPATVAGSYGGQDMSKPLPGSKGVPEGYGVLQGADKTWRIHGKDGFVTGQDGQRRSFKDMDEVNAYFASLGGGAQTSAAGENAELESLRNAAGTTPEVKPQPAPAAVSTTPSPVAAMPGAPAVKPPAKMIDTSWATGAPQPAQMPAAGAAMAATPPPGTGGGIDAMIADAMKRKPVQVPPVASPAPRTAGSAISPMPTTAPMPPGPNATAFGENPVTNAVAGLWNRFSSAVFPAAPAQPHASLPAMAGPMAASAPSEIGPQKPRRTGMEAGGYQYDPKSGKPAPGWVTPGQGSPAPAGSAWGRQPQAAPGVQFNPFASLQPRRRQVNVLPA